MCTSVRRDAMWWRMVRRSGSRILSSLVVLGGGVTGTMLSLGCAHDTTGPALVASAHLYYQLMLNHHAITLALTAPYDTCQLAAIAQTATGGPVTDTSTTTYTVLNGDANVTVSHSGLLTGVAPDVGAQVVASRTINNVTHADTAIVNVNDVSPVPHFARLVFSVSPGNVFQTTIDSSESNDFSLYTTALATNGDSIPQAAVKISSLPTLLTGGFPFGSNLISEVTPGVDLIFAEAMIYGTSRTDTIRYAVGWPSISNITVYPQTPVGHLTPLGYFGPHDDTVAVGATVAWRNELGLPIDVVFTDSTAVMSTDSTRCYNQFRGDGFCSFDGFFDLVYRQQGGAGNIPAFTRDTVCIVSGLVVSGNQGCDNFADVTRARRFPTVGTYAYHSALYGTTGVIHVLPPFQGLPQHGP